MFAYGFRMFIFCSGDFLLDHNHVFTFFPPQSRHGENLSP